MRCLCHQPWCSEQQEEMLLRLPDQDYQKRRWLAALGVDEYSAHVGSGRIAIWHFDPHDLAVENCGSGDVSMNVGFRDEAYPKHVTKGDMEIRMKMAVLNEIRLCATVKALEKKLHEERIARNKTTVAPEPSSSECTASNWSRGNPNRTSEDGSTTVTQAGKPGVESAYERGGEKTRGSGSQEGVQGFAAVDLLRHDSARAALLASLGRAQEEARGSIMNNLIPTAKAMLGEFVEGFSREVLQHANDAVGRSVKLLFEQKGGVAPIVPKDNPSDLVRGTNEAHRQPQERVSIARAPDALRLRGVPQSESVHWPVDAAGGVVDGEDEHRRESRKKRRSRSPETEAGISAAPSGSHDGNKKMRQSKATRREWQSSSHKSSPSPASARQPAQAMSWERPSSAGLPEAGRGDTNSTYTPQPRKGYKILLARDSRGKGENAERGQEGVPPSPRGSRPDPSLGRQSVQAALSHHRASVPAQRSSGSESTTPTAMEDDASEAVSASRRRGWVCRRHPG